MRKLILSPSSVKSSYPKTTMEDIQSEKNKGDNRESYYFPDCRKDANCNCKICLESMNATLDLMPVSVQKSTLTKLSVSKPFVEKTPVSIDPTLLSTPVSRTPKKIRVSTSTPLRSTAKKSYSGNLEAKKRKSRFGLKFFRWVLFLGLIFGVELGFSGGIVRVLRPRLSAEIVRDVARNCSYVKSLSEKLIIIQQGLEGYVDGKVSSCNLADSTWKINQDDLILKSECIMYKSATEEVILWGWPLQTSGLLTAGFSSRSFTVLSGQITEWPEGIIVPVVKEANSTWIQRKWSASVVQLSPNTWIIEYKQNMFMENPSIFLSAIEFFKFWVSKFMARMKHQLWMLPGLRNHCTSSISKVGLSIPT